MASVLIVYATKKGHTRKIAQRMAETLRARGHVAELYDTDRPPILDPRRFQAVIVGAPIYARGYPRSIAGFARDHKELLDRVPSAFFSVGLGLLSKATDGRAGTLAIVDEFANKSGWQPRRIELFAGALSYSKYNFLIRFVMRRIAAAESGDTDTSRDYEYTNWAAVDRFALEMAARAAAAEPPGGKLEGGEPPKAPAPRPGSPPLAS